MRILLSSQDLQLREFLLDYFEKKFVFEDIVIIDANESVIESLQTNAFNIAFIDYESDSVSALKILTDKTLKTLDTFYIYIFKSNSEIAKLKQYFIGDKHKGKQDFVQVAYNNPNWDINIAIELTKKINKVEKLLNFNLKNNWIIFVHGFYGDTKTWASLGSLIKADDSIANRYKRHYFNYNTFKIKSIIPCLFLPGRLLRPQKISNLLKTEVERISEKSENIILVGHSLGGIIIKHFLLKNQSQIDKLKISKVVLFSSPHQGSFWAWLFPFMLANFTHLFFIAKYHPFLFFLNRKWHKSKIENSLPVVAFMTYHDRFVNSNSSEGNLKIVKHYENRSHVSIIRPTNHNDEVYQDFRKQILF